MKALLLIFGLTLSLGAYANNSGYGEDQVGCGGAEELKGCKCIKQSIADEDAVPREPQVPADTGTTSGTKK